MNWLIEHVALLVSRHRRWGWILLFTLSLPPGLGLLGFQRRERQQAQWAEVAAALDVIESMHEDELFSRRDLAALVASKVGGDEFVCFYYRRHHHHLSVLVLRGERLILEKLKKK